MTFGEPYNLNLKVEGNRLTASLNGEIVLQAVDEANRLTGGGVALICEVGTAAMVSMTYHVDDFQKRVKTLSFFKIYTLYKLNLCS